MRKTLSVLFVLAVLAFIDGNISFADENTASVGGNSELSRKLDKIADGQTEIIRKLDEIKSELQVVKVRASQG